MATQNGTRWQGREVVIVEAARTPIGRGHQAKGWYRDVPAGGTGTGTLIQRI
jgi:hypothetical protein